MDNMVIDVKNVSKKFGSQEVLKNVSISCTVGQIYGLIGRNGSGKTVLLKCIIGLLKPESGEIIVKGKRIGKDIDFSDDIGFIIEQPGFLSSATCLTNLKHLASIKRRIGKNQIIEAISFVGLDPHSKKRVGKYSMGMQQRLGIAQAIMENPDVLIFDEPMNGIDNNGVMDIRNMILDLKRDGKTVLLASHNREDIEILCDEVYEIDNGILSHVTVSA
ncbi:MAG: ATP-binding cassette domain-containing protein [Oscillospiraceae bacterium]|jgi:ABC-2 type transport system ATP-binding protein|nr:ATP-binding cassette domain-containing protein [Oscillospiraceae bacterium]